MLQNISNMLFLSWGRKGIMVFPQKYEASAQLFSTRTHTGASQLESVNVCQCVMVISAVIFCLSI